MSAQNPTIVIADDDRLTLSAYKAAAERKGYKVLAAEDGDAAIRLVETNPVDILLLDILMPKKEGLETLIELKQKYPALKIIAMSAGGSRSNTDFLLIAEKFGADGILRKPFAPAALFQLIESFQPDALQKNVG